MYRIVDIHGELVTCAADFEVALSLLRRIPRADSVWDGEAVVRLAYKPGGNLVPMATFGRDAGTPVMHKALAS